MADFNRHLKKSKILVFFTIFAFLYMSCFTSCSKPKSQEKTEAAQKSGRVEKSENNEVAKVEGASSQLAAESDKATQSDKIDDPCAGCPPGVDASGENTGQKRPLTQEERNQMADKLDCYFRVLEEAEKEIPRDTFDPQAVIDKVGKDPAALFKWVRDTTDFVPYKGVLRGPIGVLNDRMGNSLDRALLLHHLLSLSGHRVRLARGHLKKQQAIDLVNQIKPESSGADLEQLKYSYREIKEFIEERTSPCQLNKENLAKVIYDNIKQQEEIENQLKSRIANQTAFLVQALEKYQKEAELREEDATLGTLLDHWWVQIENDGGWTDMDPTMVKAEAGQAISALENTFQPGDLDPAVFHYLKIRVIVEKWINGEFQENTVLEHRLTPSEIIGQPIVLQHIPMNWPKDFNIFTDKDPVKELKKNVVQEKEWRPALIIGNDQILQASFKDSGQVNKSPAKQRQRSGPSGVAGGLLGALSGSKPEENAKEESFLTAEWMEYEIVSPGSEPQRIRRPVFDLIGFVQRKNGISKLKEFSEQQRLERGLALLGETRVLPLVCRMSPAFYVFLKIRNLLANRQVLVDAIREEPGKGRRDWSEQTRQLKQIPGPEYDWALVRTDVHPSSSDIFMDRINIVSFFNGIRENSKLELVGFHGLDIIANEVAVIPHRRVDHFQLRLAQGVIDTNVESLLVKKKGEVGENTAELFEESIHLGTKWIIIEDMQDQNRQRDQLTEDDRALIERDLASGYVVVVPQERIQVEEKSLLAWWRINPKTGETLGICASGRGLQLAEYVLEVAIVALENLYCWLHAKTRVGYVLCALGLIFGGLGIWGVHIGEKIVGLFSHLIGVILNGAGGFDEKWVKNEF